MSNSALALCGFIVVASPANADWQYTRWGMTPEQVKTSSRGAATENTDTELDAKELKAKLTAPYRSGALLFRADFLFNSANKLSVVRLKLDDSGSCISLISQLSVTY